MTQPVFVEGAEPGDAIAIRIESIQVTSDATASGNDRTIEGRFIGDPFVARVCPGCGTRNPSSHIEGIGPDAVRCDKCGAPVAPFAFTNGYTMVFDPDRQVGLTVDKKAADSIGADGRHYMQTPDQSIQNPVGCPGPRRICRGLPHGCVPSSDSWARLRPAHCRIPIMPGILAAFCWGRPTSIARQKSPCAIRRTAIWISTRCAPGQSLYARSR